jgi:glycosyltransferase involved in cell wall biosynthesis
LDKNIKNPLVSVIMPVYNCVHFVGDAIDSIISQTFNNFELIIIDDCSTDGTFGVISSYVHPQIKIIKKVANTGLVTSLNLGIEKAAGEFIARMDGDDVCHPDRLRQQVNLLTADSEIVLCGTWYQLLNTNQIVKHPLSHEEIKLALLDYCALGHPTVMFRKQFILQNNLKYNVNSAAAEDYDLWTKIISLGKVANIPQTLLFYRTHPNQVSRTRQYDQETNSELCRIRMLCYPITQPSELDWAISRIIIRNESPQSLKKLKEILLWLDHLIDLNDLVSFYKEELFRQYVTKKKIDFARRFFLNTTTYNPVVLFKTATMNIELDKYLKFNEIIKFVFKCLLFWR